MTRSSCALAALGLLALANACSAQPAEARSGLGVPGLPSREFRGAWVATVANIDWPSTPGAATQVQQAELEAILDRAAALHLNALVFQVRPTCDALYASPLEPWSEWLTGQQGKAPEPLWDPLAFAVQGAHARGLELHAWFNPYRARHARSLSEASRDHVSRRMPGATVTYGKQLWLDPGDARAREHSLRVVLDVVRRYDIDGVHLDDYFYPYPVKQQVFPDQASYRRYLGGGGKATRAAWRRDNVNRFIRALHSGIKELKPWVKFGISPFGIARPGLPKGIAAGIDQYDQLYADVRKWLREGWCDYMAPQLYWPIAQTKQSYPVLLDWWVEQNAAARHIWPGNYTSKVGTSKKWRPSEIAEQIGITRRTRGASGNIHFSMRALQRAPGDRLLRGVYAKLALVPASPWLDADPPAAPEVEIVGHEQERLRWRADPDVRYRLLYLHRSGRWELDRVLPATTLALDLPPKQRALRRVRAFAMSAVDRAGNESGRMMHVYDD